MLIEDTLVIMIEADDHSALNDNTVAMNLPDGVHHIHAVVLRLIHLPETLYVRRLDADKDPAKIGVGEKSQHLFVARDIKRDVCDESHGAAKCSIQLAQFPDQIFRVSPVADEIVIAE